MDARELLQDLNTAVWMLFNSANPEAKAMSLEVLKKIHDKVTLALEEKS